MAVDIDGILRDLRPRLGERPVGPSGIFRNMNVGEAAAFCVVQKAMGRRVLPIAGCGKPCPTEGCSGFDYVDGCPGVEIPDAALAGPDLPDGVTHRGGRFYAHCRSCEREYELPVSLSEFDTEYSYCGGSPRCLP